MSLFSFGFKKINQSQESKSDSDKENNISKGCLATKSNLNGVLPIKRNVTAKSNSNSRKKIKTAIKVSSTKKKVDDKSKTFVSADFMNTTILGQSQNKIEKFSLGEHVHHSFPFLKSIRDKRQRKPSDTNFDESSLWISPKELKDLKLTPAMKVWWEFKQKNFDCILFFKVGKFYELYHMDADIAVQHLNLIYMKGKTSHSGFPEISFGKFATQLVFRGFRVARIEQTETPQMMRERTGKKSGCVMRQLCRIVSPGTRTLSIRDNSLNDDHEINDSKSKLVVLYQLNGTKFAFAVCDTMISKLHFDSFEDDKNYMILKTLLLTENPAEILVARGNISRKTLDVITKMLDCSPGKLNSSLITTVSEREIEFKMKKLNSNIARILEDHNAVDAGKLCFHYLSRCRIFNEIIGYGDISSYFSRDSCKAETKAIVDFDEPESPRMVLDSLALSNLDIITSKFGSGRKNTLYSYINHCCTKFGARNLRKWLISPLYSVEAIKRRQEAISVFNMLNVELRPIRKRFHKITDLERLLSKAFALGMTDDSAILYEAAKFEQKKIRLLDMLLSTTLELLGILREIHKIVSQTPSVKDTSGSFLIVQLLEQCGLNEINKEMLGFVDVLDSIKSFLVRIEDKATPEVLDIKDRLDQELHKESKNFDTKLSFWKGGTGDDRYQFEVSNKVLPKNRNAPNNWELKTTRKGFRRFHTKPIKKLVEELCVVEGQIAAKGRDKLKSAFKQLDGLKFNLMKVILATRQLDCLWSLSLVSLDGKWTQPTFLENGTPRLLLKEARHPVVSEILSLKGETFVPNTLDLNAVLLLTGANMGGKSTLIRQSCVCAILAQIGCHVPAQECRMTLFDRVFTRAGAKDCILEGQSTFAVELFETTVALKNATSRSLVAMDELGRGTSTFDGSAIAYAVLIELERLGCLAIFSTHYFNVVASVAEFPRIKPKQMQSIVTQPNQENQAEGVTFLYKLVDGSTDNSFGVNVARLAGMPDCLLELAACKSREFLSQFP